EFTTALPIQFLAGGGTPTIDTGSYSITWNAPITGYAGFTKIGSGVLVLAATNSYSGGVSITSGVIQAQTSGALGASGNSLFVDSAGILDVHGNNLTLGAISGTGTVDNLGFPSPTAGLTVGDGDASGTFGGVIKSSAGYLALTKIGSGTLALSGKNVYRGRTTVTAGVLYAGASGALSPSSSFSVTGGTLDSGAYPQTIQSLTLGNSATLNLIAGAPLTVAGSATLGGALNVSGIANGQPNAILMSYPSETGAFASAHLPGGDTLQFAAKQVSLVYPQWNASRGNWSANLNWSSAAPNGPGQTAVFVQLPISSVTVAIDQPVTLGALVLGSTTGGGTSYTVGGPSSLSFDNSGSTAFINTLAGTHTLGAPIDLKSSLLVMSASGSTLTIDGDITENQSSSLTLTGSGTLVLSGSNTYTGGTNVNAGTLEILGSSALPDGTSLTVGAGATFIFDPAYPSGGVAVGSAVVSAVPEPGILALLTAAVCGAALYRSVRSRRQKPRVTLAGKVGSASNDC
ncbi:MAG: autotransporter-associated beta strand repeat-containing protein, partial [Thermoguttaceae bacterium]